MAGLPTHLVQELNVGTVCHVFNFKREHMELQHLKKNITADEVLVCVNFSWNFTIMQQCEMNMAHWLSETVMLFTKIYITCSQTCE